MLNPDYRDILSIFAEDEVEYLLVGSYALAAHGHPRATGDIDLWVRPSLENSLRVIGALGRFGTPVEEIEEGVFAQWDLVFQIGVVPQRIDIVTAISGIADFEDAWAARIEVEIEAITIPVLSRRHLIRNKRATGRRQDLVDVTWLELY